MTDSTKDGVLPQVGAQNADDPGVEIEVDVEPTAADPAASEDPASPQETRIRALEAMLEESTTRAAQTAERLKETHDRYLRVAADFENWKKRARREQEETVKYGNERLLRDILPVVDNLERAIAAGGGGSTLHEGIRLVLKQFTEVLGRFGVKAFSSLGEPFDPGRHEALLHQESDSPANTVLSEATKGYMLHDRLLRPAAVVVSRGRPSAAPPEPPPAMDPSAEPAA